MSTVGSLVKENSIVQVICETADVNTLTPYLRPKTELNGGSGVIIDSKKGIVVTNAHVTANSQMIQVFSSITGKMPLRCELVSIIRDKDLSLIRIIEEDLKQLLELKTPDQLDARLVDHLQLEQGTPLFAAGFPLGTRLVQITSGCLSGLRTQDSFFQTKQYEDPSARHPTFLVTTAGLNFGMSGGGLFTTDGHLVGIITGGREDANQIGYAIPARVVHANYLLMLYNALPRVPTFNFRWSNVNQDTFDFLVGEEANSGENKVECKGIHIRKVFEDSIFHGVLQKHDLLHKLEFQLPELTENSLRSDFMNPDAGRWITCCIGPLGDLTADGFDKKFSMSEISDYMIYGSPVKVHFIRNGEPYTKVVKYEYRQTERVRGIYPLLDNLNWMIIDGICIQDMTLNALAECPRFKYIDENTYYDKLLHTPGVVITHVSPSCSSGSLNVFSIGDILTKINGRPVTCLKDVKKILSKLKKNSKIALEGDRDQLFVVRVGDEEEDLRPAP